MSVNCRPAGFEDDSDEDEFSFGGTDYETTNHPTIKPKYTATHQSAHPVHCPQAPSQQHVDRSNRAGFGRPSPKKQQVRQPHIDSTDWVPKTRTGPKGRPVHIKNGPSVVKGMTEGDGHMGDGMGTQSDGLQNGVADHSVGASAMLKKKPSCLQSDVLPTDDFRMAVMRNDVARVKQCLQLGIEVDTVFSTGWTALMYAANYGKEETVQLLLDNGADPSYNKDCLNVLMVACSSSCSNESEVLKCVTLLIEWKADVNSFDRYNFTPLHNATKKGKISVVKKLLESGSHIDKQDANGYTALMWAVRQNNLRLIQVLLEAGADYKKQTVTGEQAFDMANLNGFTQAEELLRAKEDPGVKCDVEAIVESAPASAMSTVEGATHITHPSTLEDNSTLPSMKAIQGPSATNVYKHGEMEMFLSGLELSELIPKFSHHNIVFQDFLRMTDGDLQKLGITQMGVRKRILDAIQDTHKTTWKTSSINIVQYNKAIASADAVAMVSNIKKHSSYIGSSIGYITDQIKSNSDILSQAEEHSGAEELSIQCEEAITNVKFLHEELVVLRNFLTEAADRPQYRPADLVHPISHKCVRRSWFSTKTLLFGAVLSGSLYYHRGSVTQWFNLFFDKFISSNR